MAALTGTNTLKIPPYVPGHVVSVVGTYTLSGALSSADTITWSNIFPDKDVTVLEVAQTTPDLDTSGSATGTINVGDGTDVDGYIDGALMNIPAGDALNFTTVGQGALIGTTISGNRDIVATVATAVATGATSGTVTVKATYYCGEL